MSHTRKKHISNAFLIGLFVMISFIAITIIIIWLGSQQFLHENVLYVTYFEGSVEGLDVGSSVKYQGVPVGTVKKIKVAPDGKLIEVIMNIDKNIQINDSLRIKAEISGIAGGKFLQLHYPTDKKSLTLFPELHFIPQYKLIKSSPSGIEEIEIAMREVISNLKQLQVREISDGTIEFLNVTSKFFNNHELYDIITNLEASSRNLNNILLHADSTKFIANVEKTGEMLFQTSQQLKNFSDNLNAEVKGMHLPEKVDKAITIYDSAVFNTRKEINTIAYRTETILFGINEALEDLKITNKQFRKAVRSMTDNPSQLLFAEPAPKEK